MAYCPKCGNENEDDAEYCIKCGISLSSINKKYSNTQTKTSSFEKQVEDFAQEVEQIGKKAGIMLEQGAKNLGEEVKDVGKRIENQVKGESSPNAESGEYKRLYRSGKNRVLAGVCGGVAEYFGVDPILIRILWAIIVFFPPGLGIILYMLFWIFVSRNPNHSWT